MHGFRECVVGLAIVSSVHFASVSSIEAVAQDCQSSKLGLPLIDFTCGEFYPNERQQAFSIKLLQTMVTKLPKQNLIFSPHSIYSTLLFAYFMSDNLREDTAKHFLNLPDKSKMSIMQGYKIGKKFHSKRAMNTSKGFEFSSVNRLFVSRVFPLEKNIIDMLKDDVEEMNFDVDPNLARMYINEWVANQTHDQIKDMIQPFEISKLTNYVLTNAAYFKGLWLLGFSTEKTKKELFYTSPRESAYVPMMQLTEPLNLWSSDELDANVLELSYNGGEFSMFIILPFSNKQHGISLLTKRLNTKILQDIVSSSKLRSQMVHLSFPKFKMDSKYYLTSILVEMEMGIGNLFSNLFHGAKISVDEKGTIAAAYTYKKSTFTFPDHPMPMPKEIRCDHPFVYFLFDKVTKSVAFIGVYDSPPISN